VSVPAATPPAATPPARSRWPALLVAAGLLALFWWSAVSASRDWSQTSDELAHLTAGFAYDRLGDFRLHPENGVIPQRVHGLGPLARGAQLPTDDAAWRRSNVWQLGWELLYGGANPADSMLADARRLNALFGVATGLFIFCLARRWYGDAGGLLALGFYALCPNFLAHSALATSDVAGSLGLLLAPWFFWRNLERRDPVSTLVAGACSGFALGAKFNGILLGPIYLLLALADAWGRGEPGRAAGRFGGNLLLAAGQAALAGLVVWACFNFRFAPRGADAPPFDTYGSEWSALLAYSGKAGALVDLARQAKLLPEAWLYGLTNVLAGAQGRPAFLLGEYRVHGWWYFFPVLFLAKTPLAMLGALGGAGAVAWRRPAGAGPSRRERWLRAAPLVISAGVVAVTAIAGNLNIGHRHLLPVYPVLFILLGGMMGAGRGWRVAALALLLGQAVESFAIRPHYLAFFNAASGGPARGHRVAVDSSLDWGQGLPALRDWLAAHRQPGEKLYLAYFGNAWPPHYGVRPDVFLPDASNFVRPAFAPYELTPGLYAVSATALSGVYAGWDRRHTGMPDSAAAQAERRFARLRTYLQTRAPEANAGYSILIFRLDAAELDAALHGPVRD
jgi:hypothetical protein